jgi:hypothetical protein
MLPLSNWELVLALATFPHWQHLQVWSWSGGVESDGTGSFGSWQIAFGF